MKLRKLRDRAISLLLTFTMVFSLLPTGAFAAWTGNHSNINIDLTNVNAPVATVTFNANPTEKQGVTCALVPNFTYTQTGLTSENPTETVNKFTAQYLAPGQVDSEPVKNLVQGTEIPIFALYINSDTLIQNQQIPFSLKKLNGSIDFTKEKLTEYFTNNGMTVDPSYATAGYPYTLFVYGTADGGLVSHSFTLGAPGVSDPAHLTASPNPLLVPLTAADGSEPIPNITITNSGKPAFIESVTLAGGLVDNGVITGISGIQDLDTVGASATIVFEGVDTSVVSGGLYSDYITIVYCPDVDVDPTATETLFIPITVYDSAVPLVTVDRLDISANTDETGTGTLNITADETNGSIAVGTLVVDGTGLTAGAVQAGTPSGAVTPYTSTITTDAKSSPNVYNMKVHTFFEIDGGAGVDIYSPLVLTVTKGMPYVKTVSVLVDGVSTSSTTPGSVLSATIVTNDGSTPIGNQIKYAWKDQNGNTLGTGTTYSVVNGDVNKTITLTITGDGTNYTSTPVDGTPSVTVNAAATYGISVDLSTLTFNAVEGYTTVPTAQTITITNDGNQEAELTFALSGTNSGVFTKTAAAPSATVAAGGEATVDLGVILGQTQGTYTGTLTVTNQNDTATPKAKATVGLTFNVADKTANTMTVSPTTLNMTYGDSAATVTVKDPVGAVSIAVTNGNGTIVNVSAYDDATKTFTVTPVAYNAGAATITVTAAGAGTVAAKTITVTVNVAKKKVPAPTITAYTDATFGSGHADGTITFDTKSGTSYEYATNSAFTANRQTVTANSASTTIKALTAVAGGTTYYIREVITDNNNYEYATTGYSSQKISQAAANTYQGTVTLTVEGVSNADYGSKATVELRSGGSTVGTTSGANGVFTTGANDLNEGKTYDVYVNGIKTTEQIVYGTAASQSATVNTYTVNFATTSTGAANVAVSAKAPDGKTPTGGTVPVTSGKVVPTGTIVTFSAASTPASVDRQWMYDGNLVASEDGLTYAKTYQGDQTGTVELELTTKTFDVTVTADKGIATVALTHTDSTGTDVAATAPDGSGNITFKDVKYGTYTIVPTYAAGYKLYTDGTTTALTGFAVMADGKIITLKSQTFASITYSGTDTTKYEQHIGGTLAMSGITVTKHYVDGAGTAIAVSGTANDTVPGWYGFATSDTSAPTVAGTNDAGEIYAFFKETINGQAITKYVKVGEARTYYNVKVDSGFTTGDLYVAAGQIGDTLTPNTLRSTTVRAYTDAAYKIKAVATATGTVTSNSYAFVSWKVTGGAIDTGTASENPATVTVTGDAEMLAQYSISAGLTVNKGTAGGTAITNEAINAGALTWPVSNPIQTEGSTVSLPKPGKATVTVGGKSYTLTDWRVVTDPSITPDKTGADYWTFQMPGRAVAVTPVWKRTYDFTVAKTSGTFNDVTYLDSTQNAVVYTITNTGYEAVDVTAAITGGSNFVIDPAFASTNLTGAGTSATGGTTTISVKNANFSAAGYTVTDSPYSGKLEVSSTVPQDGVKVDTDLSVKVVKKDIAAASVTDIADPTTGVKLDDAVTLTGNAVDTNSKTPFDFAVSNSITWTPSGDASGKAEAGVPYKITVTLTPDGNYQFTQANANAGKYTIKGVSTSEATVNVVGGNLVLTYTFPASAPTIVSLDVTGITYKSAVATPKTVSPSATTDLFYVVVPTANKNDPTITSANIIAGSGVNGAVQYGNGASFTMGNPTGMTGTLLAANTAYTVFVTGRVGSTGIPMATPVSEDFTTYYMLTVTNGTGGSIAGGASQIVSVQQGKAYTLPTTTPADRSWEFRDWTNGASVVISGNTYTPTANAETVTANFRGILDGTPTVTGTPSVGNTLTATPGSGSTKVRANGADAVFGASSTPSGLKYQWYYLSAPSTWTKIDTADGGDAGYQWTVISGAGNKYVGKEIKVEVSWTNDGKTTDVETAQTSKVGKYVANPASVTLSKVEYTNDSSATLADDKKGGLKVSFPQSVDEPLGAVGSYHVVIKAGGVQKAAKDITADGSANPYTWLVPADLVDIIPGVSYTVEVTTKKSTAVGYEDNTTPVTGGPTVAGKVKLELSDLRADGKTLTTGFSFAPVIFNNAAQQLAITPTTNAAKTGTVTVSYSNKAIPAVETTNGQTNVNITAGANKLYGISVAVADGDWYIGIPKTEVGTWEIKQAQAIITVDSLTGKLYYKDQPAGIQTDLKAAITGPGVTQATDFVLQYAITASPNSNDTSKYTFANGVLTSNVAGDFTVQTTAVYSAAADADAQYKANIKAPSAKDMGFKVTTAGVVSVQFLDNGGNAIPDNKLTTAYNGKTGPDTTQFNPTGLKVKVTFSNGTAQTYTIGTDTLPEDMAFTLTKDDLSGVDTLTHAQLVQNKNHIAADTRTLKVTYGGTAANNTATLDYVLTPKTVGYTIDAKNKTYDSTTKANGMIDAINGAKNSTIALVGADIAASDKVTGDELKIDNTQVNLTFAKAGVGTGIAVSASYKGTGTLTKALTGAAAPFYVVGNVSGTPKANIEKATLKVIALTGGIDPVSLDTPDFVNIDGTATVKRSAAGAVVGTDQFTTQPNMGVMPGDTVSITFNGDYTAVGVQSAGKNKDIENIDTLVLDAASAANYELDLTTPFATTGKFGEVLSRRVTQIDLAKAGATNQATYGTASGTYDPAAAAKDMSLKGMTVRIYWDDRSTDTYIVGTDALPKGLKFEVSGSDAALHADLDGSKVIDSTSNYSMTFNKAAAATVSVTHLGVASTAANSVAFTLDKKALNYTINAHAKVYDGTTAAQKLASVPGTVNTNAADSTITINGGQILGTDAVGIEATLTFASKDVGTRAVNATGTALTGDQAGFYTLGTATPGSAAISKYSLTVNGLTNDSVVDAISQFTKTLSPISAKATNTAANGVVAKPQFTTSVGQVLGNDALAMNFTVKYSSSQTVGAKTIDVTADKNSVASADDTGVYANYNITFAVADDVSLTNGTVTARSIVKLEVTTPPNTVTYTYPATKLNLTGMIVKLTYSDGKTESFTYGDADYIALGLTYKVGTSAGALISQGGEIPVGTGSIAVVKDTNSGTFAVTVNKQELILDTNFKWPTVYGERTYDGTADVRVKDGVNTGDNAFFTDNGKTTPITVVLTDPTSHSDTSLTSPAYTYVAKGSTGDNVNIVGYVLIPVVATKTDAAAETKAWVKVALSYDTKNFGQGSKKIQGTVAGIVGDNAGNYALANADKTGLKDFSLNSTVTKRIITVDALHVNPVYYASNPGVTTGTAAYSGTGLPVAGSAPTPDKYNSQNVLAADQSNVSIQYNVTFGQTSPTVADIGGEGKFPFNRDLATDFTVNSMALSGAAAGNYELKTTATVLDKPTAMRGAIKVNDIAAVVINADGSVAFTPVKMNVPVQDQSKLKAQTADLLKYQVKNEALKWYDTTNVLYTNENDTALGGNWYISRTSKAVFGFVQPYKVAFTLEDLHGYRFTSSTTVTLKDGAKSYTMLKTLADVTNQNDRKLDVSYTFNATAGTEKITSAVVDVNFPVHGNKVAQHSTLAKADGSAFDPDPTVKPAIDWQTKTQFVIQSGSVNWASGKKLGSVSYSAMSPTDPFNKDNPEGGYTLIFKVYAREGWDFTLDANFYISSDKEHFLVKGDEWTINKEGGSFTEGGVTVGLYELRCYMKPVELETPPTDNKIIDGVRVVLGQPSATGTPGTVTNVTPMWPKANAERPGFEKPVAVSWTKKTSSGAWVNADTTKNFEVGAIYKGTFTLELSNTYSFKANTVPDPDQVEATFQMNDILLGGVGDKAIALGAEQFDLGQNSTTKATVKISADGKTATVEMEFLPVTEPIDADVKLSQVIVLSTAPVTGATPQNPAIMHPSLTKVAQVATTQWLNIPANGKFDAGVSYTVNVTVSAKAGYVIDDKTEFYVNGDDTKIPMWDGTGDTPDAPYVQAMPGDVEYTITYAFPPTATIRIPLVQLGVLAPVTDGTISGDASILSGTDFSIVFTDPAKKVVWTKGGVEVTGFFEKGQRYTVTAVVKPDEGFTFDSKTLFYFDGNKAAATPVLDLNGDPTGAYTMTFTYPVTADPNVISNVSVGVTEPAKGATPGVPNVTTPGAEVKDYKWTTKDGTAVTGNFGASTEYKLTVTVKPTDGMTLSKDGDYYINGKDVSATKTGPDKDGNYTLTYTFPATSAEGGGSSGGDGGGGGGGGGGGAAEAVPVVTYWISDKGVTNDLTAESVAKGSKPAKVPAIKGVNGYTFKGWSLDNPEKVKEPKTVDPKTVKIEEDTTFYAIYTKGDHVIGEHLGFIKGYPDGNFGPADNITRGSVAMIIARSCLEGFEEGKDYGNGGYSDVDGHWAQSAIAYCSMKGAFKGTDLGTFQPDRPITRQEFALVFARLAGLKPTGDMPFTDMGMADDWAMSGIYTAYVNGWIIGYGDNTFKPKNNIARSEAVKIVDLYLGRGVNEVGVKDVLKDVKQWPDVPATYWAYYEIMEASNDHSYYFADDKQPPEVWTEVSK